jgi:hypothetical protein
MDPDVHIRVATDIGMLLSASRILSRDCHAIFGTNFIDELRDSRYICLQGISTLRIDEVDKLSPSQNNFFVLCQLEKMLFATTVADRMDYFTPD